MNRGDIWRVDLNPTWGREQQGVRSVLILSPREFNRLGAPLCAPISPLSRGASFARAEGYTVPLKGKGIKTDGVVLCHQIRVLDIATRKGKFVETAPDAILNEVMAKVATLIE